MTKGKIHIECKEFGSKIVSKKCLEITLLIDKNISLL